MAEILDPKQEATKRQLAASDPSVSAWVSASAGSGKTKVLSDRVLRLMLAGSPPEKILCLTFTRTAATEMCNRLTKRLAQWATAADDDLEKQLKDLSVPVEKKNAARRLFARILDTPGGLKIMTIHSFCQSLLRRFPNEAGVAPEFEVADEKQAKQLLSQAQEETFSNPVLADDLNKIVLATNEKDFANVMSDLKARLPELDRFLANKDDTAVRRAYEKAFGLPENADKDSLKKNFRTLSPERRNDLRRCAETLGRSKNKTPVKNSVAISDFLAGSEDINAYFSVFLKKEGDILKDLTTNDCADVESEMRQEAERARTLFNDLKSVELIPFSMALVRIGKALTERYEALKNELSLLDYDDLIGKATDLLEESGAAAWVLYKLDGGIDHVLLDEAQDTSPAQWRIVKALTDEFFSGESARTNAKTERTLFVVGDRKQSIFSFQGADPDEFDRMKKYFSEKIAAVSTLRIVPMDVSFRSSPAVIDAVNKTLQNPAAADSVLADGEEATHLCSRKGTGGTVELMGLVESRKAEEIPYTKPVEKRSGEKSSIAETAEAVAKKIESLIGKERLPTGKTVSAGDILVLVRRRNSFVNALTRELKSRGIPVSGADRLKITDSIAVRDLMALGDFLLLPENDLALAQVLRSPLCGVAKDDLPETGPFPERLDGISEKDLFALANGRGNRPLFGRLLDHAKETDTPLGKACAFLNDLLQKVDSLHPYELYAYVLDTLGRRKEFVRRLGQQALDAIDEFTTLALDFDMKNPPSLQLFLRGLRENDIEIKRDSDQNDDAVRIMTVHASKGLEAPIVFLPDTRQTPKTTVNLYRFDGGMPVWTPEASFRNRQADEKLAEIKARALGEYRRLLYVAMTRPRDRLYVTGWENKKTADKNKDKKPANEGNWYDLIDRSLGGQSLSYPCEIVENPKEKSDDTTECPELPDWAVKRAPDDAPLEKPYAPSHADDDDIAFESPLSADRAAAQIKGTLIHKLLEILPDYPANKQRDAALSFLAAQGGDEALADKVLAIVQNPAFAPLFGPGSVAEASVCGITDGCAFAGRVDRVAVTDTDVKIVDYKSGKHIPDSAENIPDAYLKQMRIYAALLHEIHPDKRMKCYLLWTELPRLDDITAQVGY